LLTLCSIIRYARPNFYLYAVVSIMRLDVALDANEKLTWLGICHPRLTLLTGPRPKDRYIAGGPIVNKHSVVLTDGFVVFL
jgi:hypothetical protein